MNFNWTDEPGRLILAFVAVSIATIVTNAITRLACNLMQKNNVAFEDEPGHLPRSSWQNGHSLVDPRDPGSIWD